MNFWGHHFRQFGTVEKICRACGYVIPSPADEATVKAWMIREEGCELHCGGYWHGHRRVELTQPAPTSET